MPPSLVSLPKARVSLLYQLGLAAVTIAMLILPLLYVALVGVVAWGVYFFAIHCVPAILAWNLGSSQITLLAMFVCIVTPIATGCAIVFFMIKPIFVRRRRESVAVVHNPAFEPEIGEFIHRICRAVGAPAPWRIEFDCTTDASAGFVGGWTGLLRSRLILRMGLPLVGAVSQRELAGILAHEFGHFRQGLGMRLSFLIRQINAWFVRSVYVRDDWDERLATAAESEHNWVGFFSVCASLGIMVSRRVLWLVMMIGHAISAFLMRQMEFDADAAEIQLAGSDAFRTTTRKTITLDVVRRMVDEQIAEIWHFHHHLPDNLPMLLEQKTPRLPADAVAAVDLCLLQKKAHWSATHPSPRNRMERADAMKCSGQDLSDAPARELFRQFDDLCRGATIGHYHSRGVPTASARLIPVKVLIGEAPTRPLAEERPAAAIIPFQFDDAPAVPAALP
jgi:Zn-dependent protease with chaperone function